MNLNEYQELSAQTDRTDYAGSKGDPFIISLLGLVGEAGSLVTEYKKLLRDGEGHAHFYERVGEELGDALWYIATIATKAGLSLEALAQMNLEKTRARWLLGSGSLPKFFDDEYPARQQLPRRFSYTFVYRQLTSGERRVALLDEAGEQIGDLLSDNSWGPDGYRFHDVFHLANAAMLGWSPVARGILLDGGKKRKRRDNPQVDEIEDGARASILEEGIVASIYAYAEENNFLIGAQRVDWELLKSIKRLTQHWEVKVRTEAEWEQAILRGVQVWKQVVDADGGTVTGDAESRTLTFQPPATLPRL